MSEYTFSLSNYLKFCTFSFYRTAMETFDRLYKNKVICVDGIIGSVDSRQIQMYLPEYHQPFSSTVNLCSVTRHLISQDKKASVIPSTTPPDILLAFLKEKDFNKINSYNHSLHPGTYCTIFFMVTDICLFFFSLSYQIMYLI